MEWNPPLFLSLYNSIEAENIDSELYSQALPQLVNLNITNSFTKNSKSRTSVEKGTIELNGIEYKLNKEFLYAIIKLSDDLNLDELVVSELLINSQSDIEELSIDKDSISLLNDGKIQYYLMRQHILQIVNYVVNCVPTDNEIWQKLIADKTSNQSIISNILPAFTNIHKELQEIKESINRANMLDITNTIVFKKDIKFRRDFLLKEYDILSSILFGLVNSGTLLNKKYILDVINHLSQLEVNDFFMVYYLSSTIQAFIKINEFNEQEVFDLHSKFTQYLATDKDIYKKPVKVTIIFLFLCYFIGWCKLKPDVRAVKIDFKSEVDEPMTLAVSMGALEQLLIFTADTSVIIKEGVSDIYYDMRALLERHIPRLSPIQLNDHPSTSYQQGLFNNLSLNNNLSESKFKSSIISLSEENEYLFLSAMNNTIQTIITNGAFLLTKIKDEEEDSLLSGEDLTLDDISLKADLERFFLTIYFFFYGRPSLSSVFWSDNESDAYGFIEWASKCTDSLMRSCFYLMISSLCHSEENCLNTYHFFVNGNKVSWTTISQCISDYVVKISNLSKLVTNKQQQHETEDINQTAVALEEGLNEETIIFLSSLLSLVGSVSKNLNEDIKEKMSENFTDILFEFAKIDTPLVGTVFATLSFLVPKKETNRSKFWRSLDSLIFSNSFTMPTSDSYKNAFTSLLTNYSEIMGFLHLFEKLTRNETITKDTNFLTFGKLAFPSRLGQGYRKVGVWPYIEFIMNELFVNSFKINEYESRTEMQLCLLNIIQNGLNSFDYSVIMNSNIANVNLDKLVDTTDFFCYVHESSAVAIFNHLFTEKIYTNLFLLLSIGIDNLNIDLDGGYKQKQLIQKSIQILNTIFVNQDTFLEELSPIIIKQAANNYFIPRRFGSHGLKSFFDAVTFNLSVIAHLGLYVGLDNNKIATESLKVLRIISSRCTNDIIENNKILTVFDSVDESARIKEAFMIQLEKPIDTLSDLALKLEILEYLSENLSFNDSHPSVACLLLGFQVTSVISLGPELSTFINSGRSMLHSLLSLLTSALSTLSPNNINYAPVRIVASVFEILMKLCRNPLTSHLVLDFLAEQNLFSTLLSLDPQISKYTLWNGRMYDNNSPDDCKIFIETESIGSLLSFLNYRGYLLQYLSLSIHRLSINGTPSQITALIEKLTSNTMYSTGIFSFLDSTNIGNIHKEHELQQNLHYFKSLNISFEKIKLSNYLKGNIYDFNDLQSLLGLSMRAQMTQNMLAPSGTTGNSSELKIQFAAEIKNIKYFITNNISHSRVLELLLTNIHSWVQLVQIIVTDGEMNPLSRSNFILQVFSTVVPKINDYVGYDIAFSEELVSLCVFLYDIYHKDRLQIDTHNKFEVRLYELFKACIHGINSSVTSSTLRSDFYILANNYLTTILQDKSISKSILQDLKMNSNKLVEVVSNDSIFGDGINRITSILFLDSLFQLGSLSKENFTLDSLSSGTQLLLLIRSLKNINSYLDISSNEVAVDMLLYEFTALKTTINFLTRIAQFRTGAQLLIRNKLFSVIQECDFLDLDPDVGLKLMFKRNIKKDFMQSTVNVNSRELSMLDTNSGGLSLFELYIYILQLLTAVLISMGSSNKSVIQTVRQILKKYNKLCSNILKRTVLKNSATSIDQNNIDDTNLQKLAKLIIILCSLTDYQSDAINGSLNGN